MMFLKVIGVFMGLVAVLFLCAIILWYWFNKEEDKEEDNDRSKDLVKESKYE